MSNLIDINEEISWVKVSDLYITKRGNVYRKKYLEENSGDYPVYSSATKNNGQIGSLNKYDYDGTYITWTTDGEYAGTFFLREGKFALTDRSGILIEKKDISSQTRSFFKAWLSMSAYKYVNPVSIKKMSLFQVKEMPLPICSESMQKKIIDIYNSSNANKFIYNETIDNLIDLLKRKEKALNNLLGTEGNLEKIYYLYNQGKTITEIVNGFENFDFSELYSEQHSINYENISKYFDIKMGNGKLTKTFLKNNPGEFPLYSGAIKNNGCVGFIKDFDYEGKFITFITSGYAGIFRIIENKFSISNALGILKPKVKINNLEFIKLWLNSISYKFIYSRRSTKGQNRFDALPAKNVQKMTIPILSEEFQEALVDYFVKQFEYIEKTKSTLLENKDLVNRKFNIIRTEIVETLLETQNN